MIEKIPHTIGNQIFPLKCGFGIGYGIGRKYQPIWVLVSDRNQNSGFGRTLVSSWEGWGSTCGGAFDMVSTDVRLYLARNFSMLFISACQLRLKEAITSVGSFIV